MLTKVKLRQKPLADGKLSLYLDFYPTIRPGDRQKDTPGIPAETAQCHPHIDLADWILKYLETDNN